MIREKFSTKFMIDFTDANFHRIMVSNSLRVRKFEEAIKETVKDKVVLDLGCGSGILTLLACKHGAKFVYAIDKTEIIEMAKKLIEKNGFKTKVKFLKGSSFNIKLPEKVDVIVSETIGSMGIEEGILEILYNAKKRFLKKDGKIIPSKLHLKAVPIEDKKDYNKIKILDKENYGFDLSLLTKHLVNRYYWKIGKDKEFISRPETTFSFKLGERVTYPLSKKHSFTVNKKGKLHGYLIWFEAELYHGVMLDNSPFTKNNIWRQGFLPIEKEVPLREGDIVDFTTKITFREKYYVWEWNTSYHSGKIKQGMVSPTGIILK